ncbi:MAG: hypothetical protein MZV63_46230 [Marinilabiliales bacterium]|nr:hypothetical protein [Marinilabiliales bacterium]
MVTLSCLEEVEELETVRGSRHPGLEMVPISSALVSRASMGIPSRTGGVSQVMILTGNEDPTKAERITDRQPARLRGIIVILMGVANLGKIAEVLVQNGKAKTTPL